MWMVSPEKMCRKHLLGEHSECHMLAGTIKKGISIKGYLEKGLVEAHNIKARHDILSEEISKRGYNHNSPLLHPRFTPIIGKVDVEANIIELKRRCKECFKEIK